MSKRFGFWPHITHVIVLTFKEIKHLSDYRTVGLSDRRTIGLPDYRSDPVRTIGLRISPYQKLSKLRGENLAPLFCYFFHEIGYENDQAYIFCFVKYLSTFFYTYLPVNIHFQLIIITNVSILTNPAYFVPPSCHCGILALRSRDFCDY